MRIIRFEDEKGQIRHGLDNGDAQRSVAGGLAEVLEGDLYVGLKATGQRARAARILAPVVPTNILGIGRNYAEHIQEFNNVPPEHPVLFMKNTAALNHPGEAIRLPRCQLHGPEVDYEGELAVLIGKPALNVSEAEALDFVLGYTIGNDVSARNWQRQGGGAQWCRGKGFDTFCPLGPVLVTSDELRDPQQLKIQSRLNGIIMQDSHTSRMIHSVAKLIAFLSQDTTLLPGTVILTGTPAGVGSARDPQVFLKDGDVIEVEIEGIGVLRNPVVQ
jgi:2-keto-4-pentenoate hydratase/2-oxohepta-3-ene-1,7-dioic acid hydratase in catechol pathway